MLSPEEAALRGRIGAHVTHGRHDSKELTAPARSRFLKRFEVAADPEGLLPPDERRRRASHLLAAHMQKLALLSARSRRAKHATR
jgi:hypothetical protein